MSRIFAYVRISKMEKNTENQINDIKEAGFTIEQDCVLTEAISGSMAVVRRKGFMALLDQMGTGDVLVVTKLDRLGRDAIDVSKTVAKLKQMGIKVYCLAFGDVDLTSLAGEVTMGVINVVARFERDLLTERIQSSIVRTESNRKSAGRPPILSESQTKQVLEQLQEAKTITAVARSFNISRQTVSRIRNANDY